MHHAIDYFGILLRKLSVFGKLGSSILSQGFLVYFYTKTLRSFCLYLLTSSMMSSRTRYFSSLYDLTNNYWQVPWNIICLFRLSSVAPLCNIYFSTFNRVSSNFQPPSFPCICSCSNFVVQHLCVCFLPSTLKVQSRHSVYYMFTTCTVKVKNSKMSNHDYRW